MKLKKALVWIPVLLTLLCSGLWLGWRWYDQNVDRSGWVQEDGILLYRDFHGDPVTGWREIDGERYYFFEDHNRAVQWLTLGDRTYYMGLNGAMQTGWQTIEGNTYCFDSGGYMYTGWQAVDDQLYYFGEDGIRRTGWLELDTGRRYLDENGILLTFWQEIDGDRYYLGERGIAHTGWLEQDGLRFYFEEDGALHTGWLEDNGQTLYLNEDGTPVTGCQEIDGSTYLFSPEGYLHTGWTERDGNTYCFGTDGTMLTGWQEIDGRIYCFGDDGIMQTGWAQRGEYRYYLKEDGSAATEPTEIDGRTHYFTPKGIHVLLVNPWNPVPDDYRADLVEIEDGYLVDKSCLDALQRMLADCRAAGLNPSFTSTYRTWNDQVDIINDYITLYQEQGSSYEDAVALTNKIAAKPGTSEHHLGLAMDIVGSANTARVHAWLHEHCWEYGFILRYLEGKQSITGFIPEAWHFRYVGTEVSMDMKDSGLCLEEYLQATK